MKYILLLLICSLLQAESAKQHNSSCKYSFKQLPEGGFRVVYEFDALSRDQQLEIAKNTYAACQNNYISYMRNASIVVAIVGLASGMITAVAGDDSDGYYSNQPRKSVGKKIIATILSTFGGGVAGWSLCELYSAFYPTNSFFPAGFYPDKDVFDIHRLYWEAELGISEKEGSYEKAMREGESIFYGQPIRAKLFGSFETAYQQAQHAKLNQL